MSASEIKVLELNFKDWEQTRGTGLADIPPFAYYCLEHSLKTRDVTDADIASGFTDGADDMSVDAIYVFANGDSCPEGTAFPSSVQDIEVLVYQLKDGAHRGFSEIDVGQWETFASDLLNLSGPASHLSTRYNTKLLAILTDFRKKFLKIAGQLPNLAVRFFYIVRCDECVPNAKVTTAFEGVKAAVASQMSAAKVSGDFINAQGILDLVRINPRITKSLAFREIMAAEQGFVGIVGLGEFYKFIGEGGHWNSRLFDANIRGYQGETNLNERIREALKQPAPDFWLLNNGVTILASDARTSGARVVQIGNPQIVNGMQTSRAIFDNFVNHADPSSDPRSVLVRVLSDVEGDVYEKIVRATNEQHKMNPASLRSTDEIHGQIEALFLSDDLYYDRKRGHYKDLGKAASKIVSVSQVLQAIVAMVLHKPDDARARPGIYLTKDNKYNEVFTKDRYPLETYLKCIRIMERIDQELNGLVSDRGHRRNVRFYVAHQVICQLTVSAAPTARQIVDLDVSGVTSEIVKHCYLRVRKEYDALGGTDRVSKGTQLINRLKVQSVLA